MTRVGQLAGNTTHAQWLGPISSLANCSLLPKPPWPAEQSCCNICHDITAREQLDCSLLSCPTLSRLFPAMSKQLDIMERFSGWTRIFQFWSLVVNWLGSYVWQWGVTLCSQKALLCLSLARKSARARVLRAWARTDPVLGITRCPERQFRNNPAVLRTTCASVELLTNQPVHSGFWNHQQAEFYQGEGGKCWVEYFLGRGWSLKSVSNMLAGCMSR